MVDNQHYDVLQAALIPAAVVGILSVPGFAYGGIEFAGHTLALGSTVALGSESIRYGTILALVSFGMIGFVNDAWSSITDAETDDVERYTVAGATGTTALVPIIASLKDVVTTTLWAGVPFAILGLAAVYYVAFTR